MDVYTSGPWNGRGYTQSELSLNKTALREHTLVVFIAGEWGSFGVIGLMFAYILIAFAGMTLLPWNRDEDTTESTDIISAFVGLTSLTFAFASIYIILASYNLLPFTGKNLYLFGLDSGSDILESSVLLVIIALGAAMIKDKETT
jgi:cell division protein FtsW (lipid II flippase)